MPNLAFVSVCSNKIEKIK